jgi:hypothetical protein
VNTPAAPGPEQDPVVSLFREVLVKFTGAVKELYGARLDEELGNLLCREFNCPHDFDPAILDGTNAVNVLAVIEKGVAAAGFRKRNRLRKCAREIIKRLYETHTEVLQNHGVEGRVLECYQVLES